MKNKVLLMFLIGMVFLIPLVSASLFQNNKVFLHKQLTIQQKHFLEHYSKHYKRFLEHYKHQKHFKDYG